MKLKKASLTKKNKVIIGAAIVAVSLIAIGIFSADAATLGNMIIISVFLSLGPYFLYSYSRMVWVKSLEAQFPNFVRDLADSSRSGMSFPEAVRIATKAHYGKLSPEIEIMNNRLSWGTPFLRVLEIFGERVKESRIITEALEIIKHSYESGGSIPATLDSVSKDIIMLQEAEAERSSMVKQHVMIMYGVFFMFVGIAIMIIYVMVPMIEAQSNVETSSNMMMGFEFKNPCEAGTIFPCSFFSMICVFFNVSEGIGCYYLALFFTVIIITGVFTGLIAGQLGDNSVIAGVKHSMVMVIAAIAIFMFLSKVGLLPI